MGIDVVDITESVNIALNLGPTHDPITANYARISAIRIVTAVTRPRMSASPG
jgi:hypothetical protein